MLLIIAITDWSSEISRKEFRRSNFNSLRVSIPTYWLADLKQALTTRAGALPVQVLDWNSKVSSWRSCLWCSWQPVLDIVSGTVPYWNSSPLLFLRIVTGDFRGLWCESSVLNMEVRERSWYDLRSSFLRRQELEIRADVLWDTDVESSAHRGPDSYHSVLVLHHFWACIVDSSG